MRQLKSRRRGRGRSGKIRRIRLRPGILSPSCIVFEAIRSNHPTFMALRDSPPVPNIHRKCMKLMHLNVPTESVQLTDVGR
jgi:hypothetical protein